VMVRVDEARHDGAPAKIFQRGLHPASAMTSHSLPTATILPPA
jgi:hypothetical protein